MTSHADSLVDKVNQPISFSLKGEASLRGNPKNDVEAKTYQNREKHRKALLTQKGVPAEEAAPDKAAPAEAAPSAAVAADKPVSSLKGDADLSDMITGAATVNKALLKEEEKRKARTAEKIAGAASAAAAGDAGLAIVDDVGSDLVDDIVKTGRRTAINDFIMQVSHAAALGLDTCYGSGVRNAFALFVSNPGIGTAESLVKSVFETASTLADTAGSTTKGIAYRGAPVIMEAIALARATHPSNSQKIDQIALDPNWLGLGDYFNTSATFNRQLDVEIVHKVYLASLLGLSPAMSQYLSVRIVSIIAAMHAIMWDSSTDLRDASKTWAFRQCVDLLDGAENSLYLKPLIRLLGVPAFVYFMQRCYGAKFSKLADTSATVAAKDDDGDENMGDISSNKPIQMRAATNALYSIFFAYNVKLDGVAKDDL